MGQHNGPLPETMIEAIRQFADPDVSLAFAASAKWPTGPACPRCGQAEPSFLSTRRLWKCRGCKKQFSVKVGTIFEDSPIPLDKWLTALWMLVNAKNGVSSYEIGRDLGITQKSAWFVLQRLRLALKDRSFTKMGGGSGPVEVDETFVGGNLQNMHKEKRGRYAIKGGNKGKTIVQ